ncbi:Flp pilus assembly protein CpaB [Lederbergia graminis]|uniref:Flp pilus assembly protein CpaB n=1 Tax=Lederbergia graminis TaxID=735518 RepID=A0ABW0LFX8_9BACI
MISAKRKAFFFLTIAFILAVVTGWFITSQVSEAKELMGQSIKVAVAKKELPAYTEITPEMVEWLSVPKSSAVSSFITNEKDLEEHLLIVDVKKGDLLTDNILRARVDIPEGHRVVWLNPTQNVIMDQAIYNGDKVDIIASYKLDNGGKIETKRILNEISVIQSENVQLENNRSGTAIKVSLTLEQAEQLIHLQNTAEQIRVLRINQLKPDVPNPVQTEETPDPNQNQAEQQNNNEQVNQEQQGNNQAQQQQENEENKEEKKE